MGKLIHLNPRPETIQRIGRKMKGLSLNQALKKNLVTPKEAIIYQGCYLRLIIK
jgi:hypothetical protein